MSELTIKTSSDFLSSNLLAQFEAMVRVATALRNMLETTDFSDEKRDQKFTWISAVEILAKAAAKQVPKFDKAADLNNFWVSFLASKDVQSMPRRYRKFLGAVRDRSLALSKLNALSVLDKANKVGYERVKALLKSKGIKQKPPGSAVPVELVYDSEGKEFCAAASPYRQSIRWAFQPKFEHCLYGLMCLDYVFAHEYLSHLVPTNPSMDVSFSEQWLVVALNRAVVNTSSEPISQRHLWAFYRKRLESHVEREIDKIDPDTLKSPSLGGLLVKDTANFIYILNPNTFWSLTGEMMGDGDDDQLANAAMRIMEDFDPDRIQLDKANTYSINDLQELMDAE